MDEKIIEKAFLMNCNLLFDSREELKNRWERFAEFGNPLQQYRAVQFADIMVGAVHIEDFDTGFLLKSLNHITVYESGKLVVTFLDGTEMECEGE